MNDPNATPTGIHLTTTYFWLAFLLAFFKPQVSIDGAPPVTVSWGDAFFPATPGAHRVNVWFDYLFFGACGKAEVVCEVPAGGVVPLRYKAPVWFVFSPGTLAVDAPAPGAALPGGAAPGAAAPVSPQFAAPRAPSAPHAPAAPQAPPAPQWDAQRNAWVHYDAAHQCWMRFDDATQQWRPLA